MKPGYEASVDLELKKAPPLPCTKLLGRVMGVREPIQGATVKILDRDFKPLYHTNTDDAGRFSFINTLMPGEYEITAAAEGYKACRSRLISLMPMKTLFVTIRLSPDKIAGLGTLYGIARDEKNAPLPGVQVYVFSQSNIEFPKAVTVSNADGEYLVYGLKPGKYVIRAFLKGWIFPYGITADLDPGGIVCADLYLYMEPSARNGTVSGKVTHDGAEIPNAVTALYSVKDDAYTLIQVQEANDKGFYLFTGCKPGKYVVKAKLEGDYKTLCFDHDVE